MQDDGDSRFQEKLDAITQEPWWREHEHTFTEPEFGYENIPGELMGRLPFLARGEQFFIAHFGEHHSDIYSHHDCPWQYRRRAIDFERRDPEVESEQGDIAWSLTPDGALEILVHLPPKASREIAPLVEAASFEQISDYLYTHGAPEETLRLKSKLAHGHSLGL